MEAVRYERVHLVIDVKLSARLLFLERGSVLFSVSPADHMLPAER